MRKEGLQEVVEDTDSVLDKKKILFLLDVVKIKRMSRHYNDLFAKYFEIDKTRELIAKKYYWSTIWADVETYIKGCHVYLTSKVERYKLYCYLELLPVLSQQWEDLSIDFMTGLPISTNWKSKKYDFILVIVDQLTKMVYYKLIKTTIDAPRLAKFIINMVVQYYGLLDSIISNHGSVFSPNFGSLTCYFFKIKKKI